jgi:hypothetical protein
MDTNEEPTSGLEPLYCSLRVITQALQGYANLAYLSGFSFPALLSVAPYCVPGGIRVVSGAHVLRGSPTRKKGSAACLFVPCQGVGDGLF